VKLATVVTLSYYSPDLYAAIDSVLDQDYERVQYVLIDDGTAGFSPETVTAYIEAHRRCNLESFVVYQTPANLGTVRALNIGLGYANGEYVFNLAGDDAFADSQVIKDWVAAFDNTGSPVITAYREFRDQWLMNPIELHPRQDEVKQIKELSPKELFEVMTAGNFIFGCCTAYTRNCIEKYHLYDEHYKFVEDFPAVLSLLRQGVKIDFFDRIVVLHRSGGSSSATSYNTAYQHDMDLIYAREIQPYTNHPRRARRQHIYWKRRQKFLQKLEKVRGNPFRVIYLRVLFNGLHPIFTLRSLLARFSRGRQCSGKSGNC